MHLKILSFNGTSNIGLHVYVTNTYGFVGEDIPDQIVSELEDLFQVPLKRLSIAGTTLIGAFLAGNEDILLVPDVIREDEEKIIADAGVNYAVLPTTYNCLGNNILINDVAAAINPEFSHEDAQLIADTTGLQVEKHAFSGINTAGSLGVFNIDKQKLIISNHITVEEYEYIETFFDVKATPTTVNMGSPRLRSGVASNKHGFAVGKQSGGPEITTIDEGLGFL